MTAAWADDPYPARTIRIIVPSTAGTGMDLLARILGQRMGEDWHVPVVVEDRAGASGNIGTALVAASPPDGYTLLLASDAIVSNSSLYKNLPYDPIKDFVSILHIGASEFALVTNPQLRVKTVQDFIALAKSRPGALNYGSPGNGSRHHLAMESFKVASGIDIVHIPYVGTAPAVQGLLGGQISAMFLPINVALPYVQTGKLDMLAAGGARRSPFTPNVPCLSEAGIVGMTTDTWYALFAPAGTPREVVTKLSTKVDSLLRDPEISEQVRAQSIQLTGGKPEDLDRIMREDLKRFAKLVRDAGIKFD